MINLAAATIIVTIFSVRTAASEEIGWRGYMLTRLIDAGVPRPVLVSGVIWGLWHVPLILGGVYLAGPPPVLSAVLWMVTATAFSFVFARLRLATLWVGESGILVALATIVAAVIFSRGQWTIRRDPVTAESYTSRPTVGCVQ